MNKKLYSLFVFIYIIIAYCATVQGNRGTNAKNGGNDPSMIKKRYQKNYNKGNKHMQRTDEDDTENNEEFYENYKINKALMHSVNENEKEVIKGFHKILKMHKALTFGIFTLVTLNILAIIRGYFASSISSPNSHISQLIDNAVDNKNQKS
ncbi:conserved rodent malaria protein, unknown function [Plasmodium vinckei vinckei]|uniref:Uncharacterized protein n=1 Tax=Plasmodium vinckei vinckei TaxID=54757 RepID=A0A081I989_PLAVN|nr:conserved rodent malaria protein, unknown function [Plasmodium vinckei vinckei]KEG00247.1 hypothetical protein YYE_04758 [Plasmodium vinckei vinckei]VEV54401.1 conserved rodent malaria protein, unknown function [Plasmodium vinckei vinckei]